ncbi:response regulator [Arenibacter algicola]|uniref:response regulator n=1 Tax=Arenibacter algicola TaxID=616991 RepID=UPI0004DF1C66|nr:response regulator [Arenibacter algicola]
MKAKTVLLIENCDLDAILIKESLKQNGKLCNINLLQHRGEVAAYFEKLIVQKKNEIPDLIIANWELIMNNGVNMLSPLSSLENSFIPVVIFTSSGPDMRPHFNKQTCCYIKKPLDVREFLAIIKEIKYSWLSFVN